MWSKEKIYFTQKVDTYYTNTINKYTPVLECNFNTQKIIKGEEIIMKISLRETFIHIIIKTSLLDKILPPNCTRSAQITTLSNCTTWLSWQDTLKYHFTIIMGDFNAKVGSINAYNITDNITEWRKASEIYIAWTISSKKQQILCTTCHEV